MKVRMISLAFNTIAISVASDQTLNNPHEFQTKD